jgi:hypothetical protein
VGKQTVSSGNPAIWTMKTAIKEWVNKPFHLATLLKGAAKNLEETVVL